MSQITAYTHISPVSAGDIVVDPTRVFFATVRNGRRHGWLADPYETHQEALDALPTAKALATATDPMAYFYEFGTASLPCDLEKLPEVCLISRCY